MFKSLKRNSGVIFIQDSCFIDQIQDTMCTCSNINCAYTSFFITKFYESKNLNVNKNLAAYLIWLSDRGYSPIEELNRHTRWLERDFPKMNFALKHVKPVKQYLQNNVLFRHYRYLNK